MKVKDKKVGKMVDVAFKDCLTRQCYWARPDPGNFTHGQGYKRSPSGDRGWLCGHREIHGCPQKGGGE